MKRGLCLQGSAEATPPRLPTRIICTLKKERTVHYYRDKATFLAAVARAIECDYRHQADDRLDKVCIGQTISSRISHD